MYTRNHCLPLHSQIIPDIAAAHLFLSIVYCIRIIEWYGRPRPYTDILAQIYRRFGYTYNNIIVGLHA